MLEKNEIFKQGAVYDYEKHLAKFSSKEQAKRLKIFINKVGIIRRQMPTADNEEKFLLELSHQMKKPISKPVMNMTKALLSEDRHERMFENCKAIIEQPVKRSSLKDALDSLLPLKNNLSRGR